MNRTPKKAIKILALVLAFYVVQFYTQASLEKPSSPVSEDTTVASTGFGLLSTTGDENILVNGNEAHTGATILDGDKLETGNCVGATIRWGSLNRVDLPTNTVAFIHYGDGKLKVTLESGCARAKSLEGLAALIETPAVKTIAAKGSQTPVGHGEACYPGNNGQSFEPHCGAPVVWFCGSRAVGTVAVTVALRGNAAGSSTPTLHK